MLRYHVKSRARAVRLFYLAEEAAASTDPSAPVPAYTGGNRAEKYLPSLPTIQHGEMGNGRVREVGERRFLEVFVSWLALINEAYVSETRHCLKHPNFIEQAKLQSPVAARSAKLFYYLGQCLAEWERGLELLRSVSKRQGLSAAGYEVPRRSRTTTSKKAASLPRLVARWRGVPAATKLVALCAVLRGRSFSSYMFHMTAAANGRRVGVQRWNGPHFGGSH